MFDGEAFGTELLGIVQGAITRATEPLLTRIAALEAERSTPVRDGRDGLPGRDGKDGERGADGKDGADGRHGLNASDVDVSVKSDGRTLELSFAQGEVTHQFEVAFPFPMYRGVHEAGREYVPGDLVTFGGSIWHCDEKTSDKPSPENWTLAVKRGRDGRDAAR